MSIDVTFDDRTDSTCVDPDRCSPTLKRHHLELWSKPLPSGKPFTLAMEPGKYLVHQSNEKSFSLSSDSISNSLRPHKRLAGVIAQIDSKDLDEFQRLGSTIGAKILFPGYRIEKNQTINQARGFNGKIRDRFDLTLECIRLHYLGQQHPLATTLDFYADFFALFENFDGYVEFFLLQDLVETGRVKFFMPFEQGFDSKVLPTTFDEYHAYKQNTERFLKARNARIAAVNPS